MVPFRFLVAAAALIFAGHALSPATANAACVMNVSPYDTLNVRSGPGTGYRVIAELAHDYCGIRLTGRYSGSWGRIRFFGGRSGWVSMRYVDEGGDEGGAMGPEPAAPGRALTAHEFATGQYCPNVSWGDHLNVRSGPGKRHPVIGIFNRDYCRISGTGNCRGAWCETTNHEFTGWVNTRYLRNVESGD